MEVAIFLLPLIFSGCSLIGRSHQANHSASPVKRYLRWFYYCIGLLNHIYIFIPYSCYIEHIYISTIPFRQFSPCTALPYILQTWRNCPGVKHPFTPEQQGRAVEPLMWGLPPPHPITDEAHISGCHRKRGSSFYSEADPCPASLRERGLPSVLPHGQRPFSKSATSSKPYIPNVCLKRRTEDIGER